MVYQARDTIEGVRVALKMPFAHMVNDETLECFRREVQIVAKLSHPNILGLKNADYIDGQFVIVTALGAGTLDDRLQRRLSAAKAIEYAKQMVAAVAYAHERRVIHCDIKPENMLLMRDNRLCLMDFGIARVAQRTLKGSGAGTVGYVAPEQAMGQPSYRSDVFSLGLVMFRMFAGQLPEWPFAWPPPGHVRLKSALHPDFVSLIKKAIDVNSRRRFRDAAALQAAFERVKTPLKMKPTNGKATKTKTKSGRARKKGRA